MLAKDTALVLIGFQNDYFSSQGALHGFLEDPDRVSGALRQTVSLIRNLLATETLIVSTPIIFTPDYRELSEPAVGILASIKECGAFRRDRTGGQTVPQLRAFQDRIVEVPGKRGLNAFSNTALEERLRQRGVKNVVVAGAVTSICVDSTARSAFERGFAVSVLSDCTAGRHLVSNAVKFTSGGGVTLTLDSMPEEPERLRFVVSDSGPGMSPDQVRRIFQPFVQVDDSSSRKHGGAGLGLTIVMRMAELMEGRLTVDTEPGRGSRFILTIPVPEAENQMGEASPAPPDGALRRSARVLLAEDSRDMQRLLTRCMELAGHRVEIAEDGEIACRKALQALEQGGAFDIILMDLQMPGMDGYAATRRLRSRHYNAPIFAITAHAVDGERRRCLEIGFDDYLCKPVTREDLETAVRRALELDPKSEEGTWPAG